MNKVFFPFTFSWSQLVKLWTMGTKKEQVIFILYSIFGIGLFLYSYMQVDLGLVITRIPWLYTIEKNFQYIGYFNRPLSTIIFFTLVTGFFLLYLWLLWLSNKKDISRFTIWSIISFLTLVLSFSYNAFSYDLFNYIFDAKIITFYHQNPYMHKALDYPQDPMLSFMHWTQRTYPYGPIWLLITVPLTFLGSNIFIITFYLFKALMAMSYIGTIYFVYKILQKFYPEKAIGGIILFALNPLVIFESLVSSHNDIVMLFFAMWAIYLLLAKNYIWAFIVLCLSIAIKFATFVFLPIFIISFLLRKKESLFSTTVTKSVFYIMLIPLFLVTYRTNFQPWYLLYILVFLPFLTSKRIQYIFIYSSFISLLLYVPFLLQGNWHSLIYTFSESVFFLFTGLCASWGMVALIQIVL